MKQNLDQITIIGAGPAGLFSAFQLIQKGHKVDLYDHQGGTGKKFLVAGHGGLNLTHSEDLDKFATRYGKDHQRFERYLELFSPTDLQKWCHNLGVETFVGSSGRVFPKSMKSAEILFIWLEKLKSSPLFTLNLKHKIKEVDLKNLNVTFSNAEGNKITKKSDALIFALGGASWKKTGSTGDWVKFFEEHGIKCNPFLPMNCGFERQWSEFLISKLDRFPLKNIALSHNAGQVLGEMMITPYGIEGTSVYALSREIRDTLLKKGSATVYLDLKPDWGMVKILKVLRERNPKVSRSAFLNKNLKLQKEVNTLLIELLSKDEYNDDTILASKIKKLPISLDAIRPIDEAISTSGGVDWSEVTEDLELIKYPQVFAIGEMLDFDAPTGGYLLQGAFSTAFAAARKISNYASKD